MRVDVEYCSVAAMLRQTAELSYEIIREAG